MASADPADWSVPLAAAAMAVAAAAVWFAGARVTRRADELAQRTGLTQATVGVLLLGFVTSLPEIATTTVASAHGSAGLAVSNLMGGVAAQVAILAIADAASPSPLTSGTASPAVLLQGVGLVVLLAVALVGMTVGDADLGWTGAWTPALFVLYLGVLVLLQKGRTGDAGASRGDDPDEPGPPEDVHPWSRLVLGLAAWAVVILGAGYVLARSAEAVGEGTVLGTSFVGASLLALSTSLPEISTSVTAVRLGAVTMAFSNILGTNLLEVALLFVADLAYAGPLLRAGGTFGVVAAALGIVLTCIYLAGLLERRDRPFLRLGVDSWAVVAAYLSGMVLLYTVR